MDRDILSYYESYDELGRLGRGSGALEFARMQDLIGRFLAPPPGVVLDVGGGPGEGGNAARRGFPYGPRSGDRTLILRYLGRYAMRLGQRRQAPRSGPVWEQGTADYPANPLARSGCLVHCGRRLDAVDEPLPVSGQLAKIAFHLDTVPELIRLSEKSAEANRHGRRD